MIKLVLFFNILVSSAFGTVFFLQPVEQQIKEADGILIGNFLKKKTVRLENGSLATQMVIKMTREVGLQSEFFGMDEIIIHYPGGTLDGFTTRIEGVPEFISGEKVAIFIRSIDNRYWGMNLGYGTFKVINYGKETVLVNFLFPQHSKHGQFKLEYFEDKVKEIKGTDLKTVTSQYPTTPDESSNLRAPASIEEGQNRSVASTPEELENGTDRPNFSVFWLILILGFFGGIFRMANQKAHR